MALILGDLPEDVSTDDLLDDLVVEEDDFVDHPNFFYGEEMVRDPEVEALLPLFPDGNPDVESEWRELFGS